MNKSFLTTFLLFSILFVHGQDSLRKFNGCEIKIDNKWTKQSQGTQPINQDTLSFDQAIISNIEYPKQALRMWIEGDVVFSIEIDAAGELTKYTIVKDIGAGTNAATAMVLDKLPTKWTPATFNNTSVESRVNVLVRFHLGQISSFQDTGIYYKSYVVMATGKGRWKALNALALVKKKKSKD
jgi:Gram-negative bacterial TonB protein C-terminal